MDDQGGVQRPPERVVAEVTARSRYSAHAGGPGLSPRRRRRKPRCGSRCPPGCPRPRRGPASRGGGRPRARRTLGLGMGREEGVVAVRGAGVPGLARGDVAAARRARRRAGPPLRRGGVLDRSPATALQLNPALLTSMVARFSAWYRMSVSLHEPLGPGTTITGLTLPSSAVKRLVRTRLVPLLAPPPLLAGSEDDRLIGAVRAGDVDLVHARMRDEIGALLGAAVDHAQEARARSAA